MYQVSDIERRLLHATTQVILGPGRLGGKRVKTCGRRSSRRASFFLTGAWLPAWQSTTGVGRRHLHRMGGYLICARRKRIAQRAGEVALGHRLEDGAGRKAL